jgi:hypothetical protein
MANLNWDIQDINEIDEIDEIDETTEINETNEINNNIIINNNDIWELLLDQLGLYIMNYPMKIIQNGIVEIHIIKTSPNNSRYCRNLKFKDDSISKKIESLLFNEYTYSPYSQIQIYRAINRIHRHYKYNKIINIVDRKEDKKDSIGFNYENPRWNTLTSVWI